MKTLLSVLPRFVLPDNTVVLPEKIRRIEWSTSYEVWVIWLKNGVVFSASSARQDNATGYLAGDKMIYENDILDNSHVVYFEPEDSEWRANMMSLAWYLEGENATITGRVPYGEEP